MNHEMRLFFQDDAPHPLGRLTLAGTLWHSRGIGRRTLRTLGTYAIVLQIGSGGHYRDIHGRKLAVGMGDCVLVFPDIAHAYGPARGLIWNEIFICFDGPLFDLWRAQGLLAPSRPLHHVAGWQVAFDRLFALLEAPRPRTTEEHLEQLHAFLILLLQLVALPAEQEERSDWASQAQALLRANLSDDVSPAQVARQVGLSYESFRKNFAREFGQSPTRFRDMARIRAAQTLLGEGALKNHAVARSLGFRDEAHLARRFRELTGQSPREWKQSLKNETANE